MSFEDEDFVVAPKLETELEKDAIDFAKKHNWLVMKFVSPGKRGVPDRLFIREGRILFIEFKREGETPRAQQERRIKELRDHGANVYVCDSLEYAHLILR